MMCFGAAELYRSLKVVASMGAIDSGLVSVLSFFLILYSVLMLGFSYEADLAERFLCGVYPGHRADGMERGSD